MDDLLSFDLAHVWHPYAPMPSNVPLHHVRSARGVRLEFADGRTPIDAMSSWWTAIHGYRHPDLDAAAHAQIDVMSHVMFGGLTHEPAVALARRLLDLTPDGLKQVFFADSGSVAVEVAIKLALQYQRGRGSARRSRIATLRGGYHGETFGAMSVCDPVGGMHSMFTDVLPAQVFLPRPPAGLDADISAWAEAADRVLTESADEIAAIIVEPVLQGAGGMHIYPPAVLVWLRQRADSLGVLLIADEIATGFRRTGMLFAVNHADVTPDIMCVGKALTGGYLTLAAVLCTPEVAQGVSTSESGALMHGPTFMANPLACAIAGANLNILASSNSASQVERIGRGLAAGLAPAAELDRVIGVRTLGAVGVVQLDHPVDIAAASAAALALGVWVRPFRDLIYTMPPYISTDDDVVAISRAIVAAAGASR